MSIQFQHRSCSPVVSLIQVVGAGFFPRRKRTSEKTTSDRVGEMELGSFHFTIARSLFKIIFLQRER
ncbi:unnamed protein product [Cuscuta campestris]|uniref:Uncharacterized protein n=1 Tax=Cuscuta campestris TaxID=132261 RepID=A0A484N1L4_9ASTE|nr:unnamed protein product [Cuscuta campestris]